MVSPCSMVNGSKEISCFGSLRYCLSLEAWTNFSIHATIGNGPMYHELSFPFVPNCTIPLIGITFQENLITNHQLQLPLPHISIALLPALSLSTNSLLYQCRKEQHEILHLKIRLFLLTELPGPLA